LSATADPARKVSSPCPAPSQARGSGQARECRQSSGSCRQDELTFSSRAAWVISGPAGSNSISSGSSLLGLVQQGVPLQEVGVPVADLGQVTAH
jgi:hypothetical protein